MTRSETEPVVSEGVEAAAASMSSSREGVEEALERRLTAVQQFFGGRSVLVTGATGFMGKVLVEKLLRTCPGLRAIYAVVRPKKGRGVQQRVQDLAADSVFSRLREEQWRRLVPVAGDIAQPGLGLSPEDRARLCEDVSVVFHLAATVRFDETLRVATAINVVGTQEVLRICRDMPKLQAVVHTSTAYSQYIHRRVEERHYDAPISAAKLMALCDALQPGEQHDQELASRILGGYPNTYVFTKAVAEAMINEEFSDLPVATVRPAMVSSTSAEPYPGWIDNVYGPTGVSVGAGVGLLRVMQCDKTATANIVPCDMSVHCIIAAAWDLVANRSARGAGEQPVYNFVSSCDSPLSWDEYRGHFMRHGQQMPTLHAVWYVSLLLVPGRLAFLLCRLLLHLLPALAVDSCLLLLGKKPKLMRGYRKIHRFIDVCAPFATQNWDFENARTKALWARLSGEDRQLLPFDLRGFEWDRYFYHYVRGARCLLLKDQMDTVPAAKIRWRRLYWLHITVNVLVCLLAVSLAWRAGNAVISVIR